MVLLGQDIFLIQHAMTSFETDEETEIGKDFTLWAGKSPTLCLVCFLDE